jgi:hypothetical protein
MVDFPDFVNNIQDLIDIALTKRNAKTGFKKSGIYPLERVLATLGLPERSYLPEKVYRRNAFTINSEFIDENFLKIWKTNLKNDNLSLNCES